VVERDDRRPLAADKVLVELDDLNCRHDDTSENAIEQGQPPEAELGWAG
jgi:hypothetical protein